MSQSEFSFLCLQLLIVVIRIVLLLLLLPKCPTILKLMNNIHTTETGSWLGTTLIGLMMLPTIVTNYNSQSIVPSHGPIKGRSLLLLITIFLMIFPSFVVIWWAVLQPLILVELDFCHDILYDNRWLHNFCMKSRPSTLRATNQPAPPIKNKK